jgi:serine protease Do
MKEVERDSAPAQSFNVETAGAQSQKSLSRTIVVKITGPGLVICLILVLLSGIVVGTLVADRAGAAPTHQEQLRANAEAANSATSLSAAFAAATGAVEASVVHITTVDFDGDGEVYNQSSGSGVIVDPAGYIITNYHVIKDANKIKVRLIDGSMLTGNVAGFDEDTDIAVIKVVPGKPLKAAKLGDSDRVVVGDWVLAIGSPFGLEQTVTAGIISAKERVTDEKRSFQQFLQTDAAINPGNSGGPLVNMAGEVIGINAQIATHRGNFEGIGFAVPSTIFTDVYNQLLANGRVSRGYLGVFPTKVTPQFAQVYNMEQPVGALVHDLTDTDGPAAKAGLKSGDVIVEFDNYKIKDDRDLVRRIVATRVNTPVTLKYLRNGSLQTASVNLVERQDSAQPPKPHAITDLKPHIARVDKDAKSDQKLGFDTAPLSEMRAQQMGYKAITGVVVRTVNTDNVAYDAGLRDGDLIKEVNKQPINKQEDFLQAVNKLKSGDSLVFFIEHRSRLGTQHRFISLTIP